jgi:transcriptional regulator with XRE-family HTH domain
MKTRFDAFIQNADNRRLFQQEKLIVDATDTIARLMEEKGVTRADLAKRLGKSRAFVTQILGGDQNITLRTLADTLYALDCETDIQAMPLVQYRAGVHSFPKAPAGRVRGKLRQR